MGRCFLRAQDDQQAEECFRDAIELDGEDIDPRIELARMYERLAKPEQAFHHLNEVMLLRRQDIRNRISDEGRNVETVPLITKKSTRRRYRPRQQIQKRLMQGSQAEHLQTQYLNLRNGCEKMRNGEAASIDIWMDAARDLTDDFRSFKKFYPLDKYIKFLGYSGGSSLEAETPLDQDLTAMAERLSRGLPHPKSICRKVTDQIRLGYCRANHHPSNRNPGRLSWHTLQNLARYIPRVCSLSSKKGGSSRSVQSLRGCKGCHRILPFA